MSRAKLKRRIRQEEAREGLFSLYLMDVYRKHVVALRRAK